MFVVRTGDRPEVHWWLRGTAWTGTAERATRFASKSEAQAALDKARKFMRPSAFKASRIIAETHAGEAA